MKQTFSTNFSEPNIPPYLFCAPPHGSQGIPARGPSDSLRKALSIWNIASEMHHQIFIIFCSPPTPCCDRFTCPLRTTRRTRRAEAAVAGLSLGASSRSRASARPSADCTDCSRRRCSSKSSCAGTGPLRGPSSRQR